MKEKNYGIKVRLKFKGGLDDEDKDEEDSEPYFEISDVCKKYEQGVRDIFRTWIEDSIKTVAKDINRKWFTQDEKHFNSFIPKYIRNFNKIDEDEESKKKE